jgi:hypothetical protein
MLLDRPGAPAHPSADDAQALIEEARARARRRWWRRLTVGAALATIAAVVAVSFGGSRVGGLVRVADAGPYVDASAFSGHGELAFVSHGGLWVLSGGRVRRVFVPRGMEASAPAFSSDGRWLAYVVNGSQHGSPFAAALWIADADGSHARRVSGDLATVVGWSPVADRLAFTTDTSPPFLGGVLATRLELAAASGAPQLLVAVSTAHRQPNSIEDAVWSPDGRALALATTNPLPHGHTTVRAYPLAGGRPTTWFSIRTDRVLRVPGICTGCGGPNQIIADVAGWWPHWGIAFWAFSSGMVHNNDNTPVVIVAHPGATPYVLGDTLSDGATDALAAGRGGELAVVASTDDGREIGDGKMVEPCDAGSRTCRPIPGASVWSGRNPQRCPFASCSTFPAPGRAGSAVTLDPAWSPNGSQLAYVKAPVALTGGTPAPAWYVAHELILWNARSGATTRLAAAGAQLPTWSTDGRELLYVSGDALWLVPASGGRPVEIEDPLLPSDWLEGYAHQYYGQVAWGAQFSWFSGPGS